VWRSLAHEFAIDFAMSRAHSMNSCADVFTGRRSSVTIPESIVEKDFRLQSFRELAVEGLVGQSRQRAHTGACV
jgi:hypothetical protein